VICVEVSIRSVFSTEPKNPKVLEEFIVNKIKTRSYCWIWHFIIL